MAGRKPGQTTDVPGRTGQVHERPDLVKDGTNLSIVKLNCLSPKYNAYDPFRKIHEEIRAQGTRTSR